MFKRSLRNVFKGVSAAPEQMALLRQGLRESREAEQELHDALIARLLAAEQGLGSEAASLMAQWDAIEHAGLAPEAQAAALRTLYATLAAQHSRNLIPGTAAMAISVEISPGELLDRLTILEIKLERIADPAKLKNVRHDYELTQAVAARTLAPSPTLDQLRADLKLANEALWEIEDEIRNHERAGNFGESFVALARSVYRSNDRRAALKRQINDHLKSAIVEEKSYAPY
ncbi:MAG TPA: DUF6165 family protein [Solimonas sp.]|nr:DUF6165 family protein [Solimonas sp.]